MKWRPEGWEVIYTEELDDPVAQSWVWEEAFEAGADAMLKALINESERVNSSPVLLGEGIWVFIPEEDDV